MQKFIVYNLKIEFLKNCCYCFTMFSMLEWAIACHSNPEIRANKNKVTLYLGSAAPRRLTIGVDKSGVPVIGIPFVDKDFWQKTEWLNVVFAKNSRLPMDIEALPEHHAVGPVDRLGLIGREGRASFAIWMSVNPNLFDAIIATAQKFGGIKTGTDPLIRLVCYYAGPGKPEWLANEDVGIVGLKIEENVLADHDLIWGEKASKSKPVSKGYKNKKSKK